MAKHKGTMPTLWEVDDELWRLMKPIIDADMPRNRTGRPSASGRPVVNCIIHTDAERMPSESIAQIAGFDRTAHRYFQRWVNNGVLQKIWKKLTHACNELGGVDWRWQSADGAMGKARFGGIKWTRTQQIAVETR